MKIKSKKLSKTLIYCCALQAFFWITYCLSFGFLVAYLTQIGYSKSTVGMLIALLALMAIIAQPIYGYLADKVVDIKKIVFVCILVSVVTAVLIPFISKSIVAMIIVCVILGWSEYGLSSVFDCWCIRLGQAENLNYGVSRATGSCAYAITAAIFGFVFARVPMQITFFLHSIAGIILLFVIIKTPGIKVNKIAIKATSKLAKSAGNTRAEKKIFFILLHNYQYVVFILCAAMVFIGSSATSSFMINLLEMRGGTSEHLGYALSVQALCEIPAMILSVWLIKKFNIRFLILFSFCAYILKFILPFFSKTPWGIIFAMIIQGFSFAIFLPAAMKYLALISPQGYQNTATTLAVAVYSGIGNIFGNLFGGFISDVFGVEWVYVCSSVLACLAAILFFLFSRESREKN